MNQPPIYDDGELQRKIAELAAEVDALRCLAHNMIDRREHEIQFYARELHDRPHQVLTRLVLLLHQLRPAAGEDNAILNEAVSLAQEASTQIRQVFQDSGLSILEFVGLTDTLDWLFASFRRETGIEVDYEDCGGDEAPPFSVSLAAFRIIEEYLTGCRRIKAAWPRKLAVSLGLDAGFFTMDLSGHGSTDIDRECLLFMGERARMAGGTVAVASNPDAIRMISVAIPLNP